MAAKKVKKVTQIPEANVKIEVEQTEEDAEENEKEEVVEASEEKVEETEGATEEVKESEVENFDEESGSSISWKKVFIYTLISAFIGFIILGGLLFALNNYDLNLTKKTEEKSIVLPSTTPKPTKEPEDSVDKEAYEIEVLNGSGIAGEAAAVQTLLEDAGFKVSGIGNASNSDFEETQILTGEDIDESYLEELEKTLEDRGPVETEKAPSSQTEDVVVIVGSETSDSDTTPTPTP